MTNVPVLYSTNDHLNTSTLMLDSIDSNELESEHTFYNPFRFQASATLEFQPNTATSITKSSLCNIITINYCYYLLLLIIIINYYY